MRFVLGAGLLAVATAPWLLTLRTMTEVETSPVLSAVTPGTFRLGKRIRVPARVNFGELTPNNVGTLRKLNTVLFPVAYSDKFYKDVLDHEVTPEDFSKLIFYQDLAVGNVVCRLEPATTPLPTTLSNSVAPTPTPVASSSSAPAPPKHAPGTPTVPQKLYVMTLGVLPAYCRQGLATKLIQHIIATAEASHHPPPAPEPTSAVAAPADKKKKSDDKDAKDKAAKAKAIVPVVKPVIASIYLHVQVSNDAAKAFWEGNGFKVVDTVTNYYRKIEPRDAWVLERIIEG